MPLPSTPQNEGAPETLKKVSFRIPSAHHKLLRLIAHQAKLSIPKILEPVVMDHCERVKPYAIERMEMLIAHFQNNYPYEEPREEPRTVYEDPEQVGIRLHLSSYIILASINCTDDISVARQIEPVVIGFSERNTSEAVDYLQSWLPNN